VSRAGTRETGTPKYARVAARVRDQIADGSLLPGDSAPSGAALARATGYSIVTCRRALQTLAADGVLVPGPSRNARLRVPASIPTAGGQAVADAARALSAGLATRRRAAGLTQPQLAERVGLSITTIGHAETGRLWQSRSFWEHADKELGADGELLALLDAYRAAATNRLSPTADPPGIEATPVPQPSAAAPPVPESILIVWSDGVITALPVDRAHSQDLAALGPPDSGAAAPYSLGRLQEPPAHGRGHYDSSFTMKTYVHASDEDLKQGRQALAKIHRLA
jgi:transcriptional regulator with XRE-family HTH domain